MPSAKLIRTLSIFIEVVVFLQIGVITFYCILFTSKVNINAGNKEMVMLGVGIVASTINIGLLCLIINHFIKHGIEKQYKKFMLLKIMLMIYFVFGIVILFTVLTLEDDIARYMFMGFLFTLLMYFISLTQPQTRN